MCQLSPEQITPRTKKESEVRFKVFKAPRVVALSCSRKDVGGGAISFVFQNITGRRVIKKRLEIHQLRFFLRVDSLQLYHFLLFESRKECEFFQFCVRQGR